MPPITRRHMLRAATTGVALLAGCLGSEEKSNPPPRPGSNKEPVEHDYVSVRSTTGSVLISSADDPVRTANGPRRQYHTSFLATEADLDSIDFAETEAGAGLSSFVDATDFDTESVMLWSSGVTECHEIHLVEVTVDQDQGDPHLDFCRSTRPADVSCDEEELHTVAYAVRFPIDGQGINSYGSGGSSSCNDRPRPTGFDKTVTVQTEDEK